MARFRDRPVCAISKRLTGTILLAFTMGCLSTTTIAAPVPIDSGYNKPLAPRPGFKLVTELSDEFNGAELDRNKWLDHMSYWNGRGAEFLPSNVSVADGCLQLKTSVKDVEALKELYTMIDAALTGSVRDVDVENWSPYEYGTDWDPEKLSEPVLYAKLMEMGMRAIGGSAVMSQERTAKPGYYEVRMKTSRICMSSAFWLQGGGSEFDVTESYGTHNLDRRSEWFRQIPYKIVTSTWWCDAPPGTPKFDSMEYLAPTPLADEFFVLGFLWEDHRVAIYYNDSLVLSRDLHGIQAIDSKVFASLKHVIFDTEILLGPWLGWPTKAQLTDPDENTFYVDWIRVWEPDFPSNDPGR